MILIVLLLSGSVWAQVVTASFDRTLLSKNPSAATTRGISQVSAFYDLKTSDTKINEERSDGLDVPWKENIKIDRVGVFFTGGGNAMVPEFYLSQDSGERFLILDQQSQNQQLSQKNDTSFLNNLFNFGFRVSPNLGLGIKAYAPNYKYSESYSVNYGDGKSVKQVGSIKSSIIGVGAGFTYLLGSNWYLGGYFTGNKEVRKSDYTFIGIDEVSENMKEDKEYTTGKYGVGLSYLSGKRGGGFRFEVAFNRMNQPTYLDIGTGEQIYSALEFSTRHVTAGINVKMTKNIYYEETDLIDIIVGESNTSKAYVPQYGTFISFGNDKGHALGAAIVYYRSKGNKTLFGNDQSAKTTHRGFSFSYAYLF